MAMQLDHRLSNPDPMAADTCTLLEETPVAEAQANSQLAAAASNKISEFYRWLVGGAKESLHSVREQHGTNTNRQATAYTQSEGDAQSQPASSKGDTEPSGRRLSTSNIGFKLLQRAGWQQGQGLGAQGQGRTQPIPAWPQAGRTGIGMPSATANETARRQGAAPAQAQSSQAQQSQQKDKHAHAQQQGEARASAADAQKASGAQKRPAASKSPKRGWEGVKVEEDLDTKVKRVKQAWQAEQDQKEQNEMQRLLYRAMREPEMRVSDSSPLLRSHHRLRSRNPLL